MSFSRAEFLEKNLARQSELIRAADLKVAFLVPTATAMVGVLAALFRSSHPSTVSFLLLKLNLVPMILLFTVIGLAVFPRFRPGRGSLLFFGDIAAQDQTAYADAALAVDEEAYLRDLAETCHVTACIARTKHRLARLAYLCFLLILPFWASAVYVLSTEM
ncbi:Pycsar system effector family protein [Mangrovicoccus sp. HB161399]|uniref:Pycsar system effector family protein n=1 Tax=Mangrovicoccus sp. HB161399 TaxID=2720392 RepID=UPI0015536229|nr:Pycsar system effector family protein [Mangrovicoccus sp. HB161399]